MQVVRGSTSSRGCPRLCLTLICRPGPPARLAGVLGPQGGVANPKGGHSCGSRSQIIYTQVWNLPAAFTLLRGKNSNLLHRVQC